MAKRGWSKWLEIEKERNFEFPVKKNPVCSIVKELNWLWNGLPGPPFPHYLFVNVILYSLVPYFFSPFLFGILLHTTSLTIPLHWLHMGLQILVFNIKDISVYTQTIFCFISCICFHYERTVVWKNEGKWNKEMQADKVGNQNIK